VSKESLAPALAASCARAGISLAAFDDEIGLVKRDLGRASVREQFEAPNLVDDAGCGDVAELFAKMMGDNQRTRRRVETALRIEDANVVPSGSHLCGGHESGRGAANNYYAAVFFVRLVLVHSSGSSDRPGKRCGGAGFF